MSYSHSDPPCSSLTRASTAQRMYQALIISVPVSFAFIVLIFFYLCYLRRQRAYWSSIRMRASYADTNNGISRVRSFPFLGFRQFVLFTCLLLCVCMCKLCLFMVMVVQSELGMKKELREMLPIIVYRESFSIRDTQ
jgi:E3 ubiquitin-protein ligase ATL7/58/59